MVKRITLSVKPLNLPFPTWAGVSHHRTAAELLSPVSQLSCWLASGSDTGHWGHQLNRSHRPRPVPRQVPSPGISCTDSRYVNQASGTTPRRLVQKKLLSYRCEHRTGSTSALILNAGRLCAVRTFFSPSICCSSVLSRVVASFSWCSSLCKVCLCSFSVFNSFSRVELFKNNSF